MAMTERVFDLQMVDHMALYGVGDAHLNMIRSYFPKLKIVARGDMLKIIGSDAEIEVFSQRFEVLLKHFDVFGELKSNDIEQIMKEETPSTEPMAQMPAWMAF